MKKILCCVAVLAALCCWQSASAQLKTSYFMEGSYLRNDFNPALRPTRGYLALPGMSGVGVGLYGNAVSVDNFIYQRDGGLVTALHSSVTADEFLGRLPETGLISTNNHVNILGVGFYARKTYWTFGANVHATADVTLSKDLFRALKTLNNGSYDLGNVALDVNGYVDAYLGASFPIGKHVNVGVKAKFLVGAINAHATFDQLSMNVGENRVDGVLRGQWQGSGVCLTRTEGDVEGVDDLLNLDVNSMLQNIKSYGAAIDLGVEVRVLRDHLKVSAAITDLGFIKWASETHVGGTVDGNFYFNGYDIEGGKLDADGSISTDNLLMLDSYDGYMRRLNFNVNVGVEYNFLRNHFAVGLLSHTRVYQNMVTTELTASFNIRPVNWITLTASHTFLNGNRPGIFGAAINIHPSVINIFVGMDYIDTNLVHSGIALTSTQDLLLPRYAKSLNVYAGVGFNFGRPKYLKSK